jgi:hypothetical protein
MLASAGDEWRQKGWDDSWRLRREIAVPGSGWR